MEKGLSSVCCSVYTVKIVYGDVLHDACMDCSLFFSGKNSKVFKIVASESTQRTEVPYGKPENRGICMRHYLIGTRPMHEPLLDRYTAHVSDRLVIQW